MMQTVACALCFAGYSKSLEPVAITGNHMHTAHRRRLVLQFYRLNIFVVKKR
jgi:hypothetical protein